MLGMSVIDGTAAIILFADGFDMHGDFGTGWWIVMAVGMIAIWGLIIAGVVWVVRELMRGRTMSGAVETPAAILDRRFAAGEISAEEYRERKAVLTGEPPQP
jgi:putative membrane protein